MKVILVLTALVKYPSSATFYLTSNSYIVEKGNIVEHDNAVSDFKSHIETDDFKIANMLGYVVPTEQVSAVQ